MVDLEIKQDGDFKRIQSLPRRAWSPGDLSKLVRLLTRKYKTPNGSMELFVAQAQILAEMTKTNGCYSSLPVGGGKTLITGLAPVALEAKRPLLIVPSNLKRKTFADFAELRKHWVIPKGYPVISYELLQHKNNRTLLLDRKPDIIVLDEADWVKTEGDILGPRAGRLLEFFSKYPDTKLVALTGTPVRSSLMDFWVLVSIALKNGSPLPLRRGQAEAWADAIDVEQKLSWGDTDPMRVSAGPLLKLGDGSEQGDVRDRAIECIQKRLRDSWGFVTMRGMSCDKNIYLTKHTKIDIDPQVKEAIDLMQTCGETLDGDILETAMERADYVRQSLCGFFSLWDPEPPEHWLDARRGWKNFVRERLKLGGFADSPALVEEEYKDHPLRKCWRSVEKDFDSDSNRKIVWLSDYLINYVVKSVDKPSLVWVRYRELGKRLAKASGWRYAGGGASADNFIRRAKGDKTVIASIQAHNSGKNLQRFHRNWILNPPTSPNICEQLIGRTHREGQLRDVELNVLQHHKVLQDDLARATARADFDERLIGQPQKLTHTKTRGL